MAEWNRKPPEAIRQQHIGFRLPPPLIRAFRAEAKRANVTMTSVVENGIRTWLNERSWRRGDHEVL